VSVPIAVTACGGTQRDRTFDQALWKNDKHRTAMVNDLRTRYVHRGAMKSSLYPLLGWPEDFSGYDYNYSRHWGYCLQQKLQSGSESDWYCARGLEIYFSSPDYGRVSAVKISRRRPL
jgi:hypothetical protein